MKINLTIQLPGQPAGVVATAEYDGSLESLAMALEHLASLKDKWTDSGYFPIGAAWSVAGLPNHALGRAGMGSTPRRAASPDHPPPNPPPAS